MSSSQDRTISQKSFFAWYQKHITSAIFIGLVLGILTGLFLADRFAPVLTATQLLGSIYMNALNMMIVILLANVILSVGTPGIPGGAIASFAALATMAGLPAGVMGVYISINTLCDMGATCVNVIGDMAGCVVLKEKIKLND